MQPMPTVAKIAYPCFMSFFLVFLNTCVLATEHHNQPPWLDDFQVKYNSIKNN
jgi:hypothetical protein